MKLPMIFQVPDHLVLAQRELQEAKRSLLKAESGKAYAEAMVSFHSSTIKRLETLLLDSNNSHSLLAKSAEGENMKK